MEEKKPFVFKDWLASMSFPILICFAILIAASVGGAVKSGMFMGMMTTLALWFVVIKFPIWLKKFMANHVLISDLVLSLILMSVFAPMIGSGPTVFMAAVTQAVLISLLLTGLQVKYAEEEAGYAQATPNGI